MARPLALPVGSVRALVLLGLAARALLDLQATYTVAPWLVAALVVSAAAYVGARAMCSAMGGPPAPPPPFPTGPEGVAPRRPRPPLGLPAGTIRTLFLLAVAYGAWLWLSHHDVPEEGRPVLLVVGAFFAGVVVHAVLARARRPADTSTRLFEHAQALAAVVAAGGLVAIAATGHSASLAPWMEPTLAAVCTYYAGVR